MNWFAIGAIFAGLGVVLGAFGAHALKDKLTPELLTIFETGVRYQMYHALGLIAVAYATHRWPTAGTGHLSGWLFTIGILIFSGTLYAIAFGAPRWFGAITPIGGLCFIAGWLFLALAALRGS